MPMDMILNFPSTSRLVIACFLLLLTTTTHRALSARTVNNPPPKRHHHNHHPITFYMPAKLTNTTPSRTSPLTTNAKTNTHLPFSKPIGFFPPSGGTLIPMPYSNPATNINFPDIGISFPARATLEELELGTVTDIEENVFGDSYYGTLLGKAKGMYVVSSEDGLISSHMIALTASFTSGEYKDCLRFFGVYQKDVTESHIAVIGGTGKFLGANGYATIKAVNMSTFSRSMRRESADENEFLMFNVYLG